MASIHKQDGKPNFFCAFYDPEGFRRFRSTGTSNARIARTICVNIERAATLARNGRLSNEKALRLIRETCSAIAENHGKLAGDRAHKVLKNALEEFVRIAGGELTSYTIADWFNSWIAGRTDASPATRRDYEDIINEFLKYLGSRAGRPLTTLQTKPIEDYKQRLLSRVSPSSVNKALKVIKACCNKAVRARQLEFSPAGPVENVDAEAVGKRPFTDEELAAMLKVAPRDWRTMIYLGYYTGFRLSDCASLTWRNVDLQQFTVNKNTKKTRRTQIQPIADALLRELLEIAGDNPDAPLCPTLHGLKPSRLSALFRDDVMIPAGLREADNHKSKGKGRDGTRDGQKTSFHSLRYNFTSALRSTGAGEAVAMDIVGHESSAVSRNYTKIDLETKRAALAKLKDIGGFK